MQVFILTNGSKAEQGQMCANAESCLTSNPMHMCSHTHSIDTSTYDTALAASSTRWQAKRVWTRQRGQQAAEQQGVAAIQVHAVRLRIAPAQQAARPCQCHLWEPAHTHMACTGWTVEKCVDHEGDMRPRHQYQCLAETTPAQLHSDNGAAYIFASSKHSTQSSHSVLHGQ